MRRNPLGECRCCSAAVPGHGSCSMQSAPPATQHLETHRLPSATPEARSPVLDRVGAHVAALAGGARARPARHRGAMASRVAPPAMDSARSADSGGPSEYRRHHSHARDPDGGRESTLGRASDPWRVGQSGRRGVGANHLAAVAPTTSPAVTDVAYVSDSF